MSNPTDGFGIYDGTVPTDATNTTRLTTIANGGFSLVINYSLLFGHMTAIQNYISIAQSVGLKVLINLNNVAIWKTNAIAATFPTLSADATAAGYAGTTDQGFTTYIVNTLKNNAGVYGWYVGDEVANADHAAMLAHSGYVQSADGVKPRILVEAASKTATSACFNNTSTQFDCCDIMGDDYYPIGDENAYYPYTTAQTAAGIQSYCTAHSLSSIMVLQAHSWINYGHARAPWPTSERMNNFRADCIANMTPRIVMWYSYFDCIRANAPLGQVSAIINAVNNRNGYVFV